MRSRVQTVLLVAGFLMLSAPCYAHHSQASYDIHHQVTIRGTVVEFEYVNPHSLIHLRGKDAQGYIEEWLIETGPPSVLRRAGFTSTTIKPGDQVTITANADKKGRKEGHLLTLEKNGQVLYRGAPTGGYNDPANR